ncbi:nucleotide-binding universal stress UspA family protein [Neolewinella xylanilytica]|uniref:Nucleotide-binding universal stress UspA family protein n=1 Tax=Neolewinella xylanilytica TaxID=1514080 RepID=A0A2S6I7Y8_9BACT|nr:universal stress protein [Neolewinella xylanilytica]PPK87610.1 nucleotide-binding universal stress UspA family protein [Neolewinella xylanilytica]
MKPVKSILVPTDFSPAAMNAYRYALRLADELDAAIHLLFALPPAVSAPGYGSFVNVTDLMIDNSRQDLLAFYRKGLTLEAGKLRHVPAIQTYVEIGDLRYSIRRQVQREKNDLIVMGTTGSQGAWDDLLGTNTSVLMNRAPCPILIVPEQATYQPLRDICFATDLQGTAPFQAGSLLRSLRPFSPRMHFVHITTGDDKVPQYGLELLREVFDRPDKGYHATITERKSPHVTRAIFDFAGERDCQLVVMHRPERGWLNRLSKGSRTRDAALHTPLPLLILTDEVVVNASAEEAGMDAMAGS